MSREMLRSSVNFTLRDRILRIINEFYSGSKADFAKAIGTSTSNVGHWVSETPRAKPSASAMQFIIEKHHVNPDWLLHGRGEMLQKKTLFVNEAQTAYLTDYAHVPRSAKVVHDPEFVDLEKNTIAMEIIVPDDAMRPYAGRGDKLIFRPTSEAETGDIVLFRDRYNDWMIRRYKSAAGETLLIAENREYRDIPYDEDIRIFGKAVKVVKIVDV